MAKVFDGRVIRECVLAELKEKVASLKKQPVLAVILVGDDPVSVSYVKLKQRIAEKIGVNFQLFHYLSEIEEDEVMAKIEELNNNSEVDGIMIQIPVPPHINRDTLIRAITPDKDVDGLRYCLGIESAFKPPVVLAIDKAMGEAGVDLSKQKVLVIGHGFLVGSPLVRHIHDHYASLKKMTVIHQLTDHLDASTKKADVIVSAVGEPGLVKADMVNHGVVLIDAGTSELGGEIRGDIDPMAYDKASFYTPVPGGIGPVTVAMLMQNLVEVANQ
ncbi:MAG: Bifunctional protein FolD protein [bacterium ADurb.Bin400]|nr:MAG: Bifunctional protein FolD protein [bacterium ADurb.Bin400]